MIGRVPVLSLALALASAVAVVAVLAGAAGVAGVAAQQTPRDAVRAAGGTASIAGTVFVDGATKQPARRVRVTLTDLSGAMPGRTTTTEDNGAFVFRGLPAGRFEVKAFKSGYLNASYGASRPNRPGTPIVVKDGDTIANLVMTIAHGGVITGVVRDARGRPVPGVNVKVLKLGYNALTGERTLGAPGTGSAAVTDDRGEYRAYGQPPGGYVVLVVPPRASGRSDDPIRLLTSPSARGTYAPIFHPAATDIAAAATIALGLSEERTGIDVVTQLVPTATVSGTVASASGSLPQGVSIQLVPSGAYTEMLAGAGLRGASTQPRADGTYAFTGVAPGAYTVKAIIGRGRGATPNAPTEWAAADVYVSGQDLDVPLTLQPGVAINGQVVFEGARPTSAELEALSFMLMPPGSGGALQSNGGGHVDAGGHFTFAGVTPDIYQFAMEWNSPGAREKWTIKASTANGRESFEAPLRVNPGETLEWTITFTDKPTGLAGLLKDPGGRPATDYFILVFSADRGHWTPGSRRVRMTRPGTDGSYSLKGLPPGEYFLAAPADLEPGEWNDPTVLEALTRSSIRITVRDGEMTTQDVSIAAGRDPEALFP